MAYPVSKITQILTAVGLVLTTATAVDAVPLRAELLTSTSGFPIYLSATSSDPNNVYYATRASGLINVLDRTTGAFKSTFLDLPNSTGIQDGLLCFAFHPDYETNGLFYTYVYRDTDPFVRVVERKRSETNPLQADPTYERQIMEMPNRGSHNGGWLGFSPIDGYLYVTTGDGGANNGVDNGLPAQDPNDLHGKVLRLDVSGDDFPEDSTRNYAIPANNAFEPGEGAAEVYALGLRHPYRASFDQANGDLYIGDVGSNIYEEVNLLPAGQSGANFGWRALEGPFDVPYVDDPAPADAIDPIYYYPSVSGGVSITGGTVYRGDAIPALQGEYLFADFNQKYVRSFNVDDETLNVIDRGPELFPESLPPRITAITEDAMGELYLIDYLGGKIYRVVADVLEGDFNDDGVVDAADYTVWRDNVGNDASLLPNDIDGGEVGAAQYDRWVANYGRTDIASSAIPEPAAIGMACLGAVSLLWRRRLPA